MLQRGPALFKAPIVGIGITAVVGLFMAVISLLVFVFDLLVTPEFGALIISFVVCGMGLTTGFVVLRRLVRRREPTSLFAGIVEPTAPAARAEEPSSHAPAPEEIVVPLESPFRAEHASEDKQRWNPNAALAMPAGNEADLIREIDRPQSVSRYNTPEGGGFVAITAVIGMCIMLMSVRFARNFLLVSIPAGGVIALALYWIRRWKES